MIHDSRKMIGSLAAVTVLVTTVPLAAQRVTAGYSNQDWGLQELDQRLDGGFVSLTVADRLEITVDGTTSSWASEFEQCGGPIGLPPSCTLDSVDRSASTLGLSVGWVAWRPAAGDFTFEVVPSMGVSALWYEVDELAGERIPFDPEAGIFRDRRIAARVGAEARVLSPALGGVPVQALLAYRLRGGWSISEGCDDELCEDLLGGSSRVSTLGIGFLVEW